MSRLFAVLALLFVAGCGTVEPLPQSGGDGGGTAVADDSSSGSDAGNSAAAKPKRKPADMVTVDKVESSLSDDQRPDSPLELQAQFEKLYAEDPEKAFVELFDWQYVPEDKRRDTLGGFLTLTYTKDRSKAYPLVKGETRLWTIEDYSREISATVEEMNEGMQVPATHILEYTVQLSGGATVTSTLDICERDGIYFFYPAF